MKTEGREYSVCGTELQHIPPWRQNNREARQTALQPIHLITGCVVARRDCIMNDYTWLGEGKADTRATNWAKRRRITAYDACNSHVDVQHVLF